MSIFNFHPGDHIRIKESWYYHHGIVVEDEKVIHFTTKDNEDRHKRPINIFRDAFDKMVLQKDNIKGGFCKETDLDKIEVVKYKQEELVYTPKQVVERANSIYEQYIKLIKNPKYVEVIDRICNANIDNETGDREIAEEIYSQYPDMKFFMIPYHLKEHNCEHIATYIKTGKAYCTQEDKSGTESVKKVAVGVCIASGLALIITSEPLALLFLAGSITILGLFSKDKPQPDKPPRRPGGV